MKPSAKLVFDYLLRNRHRAVPSTELADIPMLDYRKRISELRRAGYVITRQAVPGKPYMAFRLVLMGQMGNCNWKEKEGGG